MTLTKTDRRVLAAFLDKKAAEGKHLHSTGTRLDIYGMGGRGVAIWRGGKIELPDLGSRSAQTVQRALRKLAAPNDFADAIDQQAALSAKLRRDV